MADSASNPPPTTAPDSLALKRPVRLKCKMTVDYSDHYKHGPGASGPVLTESQKVEQCGKQHMMLFCDCPKCRASGRHRYALPVRCRSRLCPHCARVRSMDWYHRLRGVRLRWPKMVTLTLVHGPDVAALVDLAHESYARVRRTMPRAFARGVYAIEVLQSSTTPGWWYAHIHALVDGTLIDRPALVALWQRLTGAYIVDVRMVDRHNVASAVLEVVKYITKPGGNLAPAQVDVLGAGVRSKRLTDTWGELSLLDTEQETSSHGLSCPECGGRLRFVGFVPAALCDAPDYRTAALARAGPAPPASC